MKTNNEELSEAQLAVQDRAVKMARYNAQLKAEQDAHNVRMAITNRAETNTNNRHYDESDIRPSIKLPAPTVEALVQTVRPALGKPYSDPAIEGMNAEQKALYGLPTAQFEAPKPIALKTQPGIQKPARGKAYSDVYSEQAEQAATLSAAEFQQTTTLPACTICREANVVCTHR